MKASWEKIEKNAGVLTVEVEPEQVIAALDRAFKKVSAKVNVPGFRKGKVPRAIFESRFGVESLYQDALDILLPESYMAAVNETGIEPVDRPEVDVQQIGKGETLKFTAKVTVKPEVELGEYKGIELPEMKAEVTAQDVEAELEQLQKRHAELVSVDTPAEDGDIAIVDFEGSIDGEPFEGGSGENYSLELGTGTFIAGFEPQIVGLSKGDEKDVEVTFPEDYHAKELAGKPAVFKVKVNEVKRKNLPALDDEFAKDVSEFDTLEEYKQDLQNRLQERKEQNNKRELENLVVEKVAEAVAIEIPAAMLDTEIEQMVSDFGNRLNMQGMNLDMYYQFTGMGEQGLREQMRTDAEKRVRNNLVLEAIASAENLEVTDEEIDAELDKMAATYKRSKDELKAIFSANGSLGGIKNDLLVKKTVEFLLQHSKTAASAA